MVSRLARQKLSHGIPNYSLMHAVPEEGTNESGNIVEIKRLEFSGSGQVDAMQQNVSLWGLTSQKDHVTLKVNLFGIGFGIVRLST